MVETFELNITPLHRSRTIRVYLPETYRRGEGLRYPVLYMHDGQNLFDDKDASYGMSWGISDYLTEQEIDLIVVGIDSNYEGYKRLDEYSPWKSSSSSKIGDTPLKQLGGEGTEYIDFIVNELKPMIDRKYRTNPDDTAMAGSSMGGLISTYAACVYPHIFRKVASVSSAYWFNQKEMEDLIKQSNLNQIDRFYLDVGTNEAGEVSDSKQYIELSESVFSLLKQKVKNCRFVVEEGAVHNEKAWKDRFPSIIDYLYER